MEDKCLNEMETSIYVDYLLNSKVKPSDNILNHVEDCIECKQKILEIWDVLKK